MWVVVDNITLNYRVCSLSVHLYSTSQTEDRSDNKCNPYSGCLVWMPRSVDSACTSSNHREPNALTSWHSSSFISHYVECSTIWAVGPEGNGCGIKVETFSLLCTSGSKTESGSPRWRQHSSGTGSLDASTMVLTAPATEDAMYWYG